MGLVSKNRYDRMCETKEHMEQTIKTLESIQMSTSEWREKLGIEATRSQAFNKNAFNMLSFSTDEIKVEQIADLYPQLLGWVKNKRNICDRIKVGSNFIKRCVHKQ